MAGKWLRVGTIKKSKAGSSYVQVDADVVLKKGQFLNIQDPRKSQFLTDEQKAKIPDFVKFEIYLAPPKEETT